MKIALSYNFGEEGAGSFLLGDGCSERNNTMLRDGLNSGNWTWTFPLAKKSSTFQRTN